MLKSYTENFALMMPLNAHKPMPKVTILVGIPCSGKSTWCKTERKYDFCRVISRDSIRLNMFTRPYQYCQNNESLVTDIFNSNLDTAIYHKENIVLDNTHCREKYIDEVLKRFENTSYRIEVKFFDCPLWKAYYRNIKRWIFTRKWIPIKVIKAMKTNYDKINKSKYDAYYRL